MRDWQSRLTKLVRYGDQMPEPLCDCYNARPPSGQPWPEGVPSNPALVAFYALCDGGVMKDYDFLPLGELRPGKEAVGGWPDDVDWDGDKGLTPGRWVVLGNMDHGPPFLWDAGKDDIALTDFDDAYGEVEFLGKTFARFVEDLFFPPPDEDDAEGALWLEALGELDRVG